MAAWAGIIGSLLGGGGGPKTVSSGPVYNAQQIAVGGQDTAALLRAMNGRPAAFGDSGGMSSLFGSLSLGGGASGTAEIGIGGNVLLIAGVGLVLFLVMR
jgi:hypothetical protein